jgi:endonuclease/exonuclease/phosphatase family metal-dependent hydrolase
MKNKSFLTRTLALLLVLLMCLPMAVACDDGSEKDPVDSTAANDETTASAEETTASDEETTAGEEETTEEDDSDKVPLRVMSFNVQASVTVAERYEAVKYHIQSYAPDLLGMQEDMGTSWADENNFKLEGYTVFGNCDTIKGVSSERAGIYVKDGLTVKEGASFVVAPEGQNRCITYDHIKKGGRFEISDELMSQLKALSNYKGAPEKIAVSDALLNGKVYTSASGSTSGFIQGRRATYVVVEKEGQTVIYINTHLMNRSQNGKYADSKANVASNNRYVLVQTLRNIERILCFEFIQDKVNELKKTYPDAAVILTADFNDTRTGVLRDFCNVDGDGVWDYITKAGYQDTGLAAKTNGGNLTSTWNSYFSATKQDKTVTIKTQIGNTTGKDGRIDFCFVSPGIKVSHYETGAPYAKAGENGREYYLSDHLSLIVDLKLG